MNPITVVVPENERHGIFRVAIDIEINGGEYKETVHILTEAPVIAVRVVRVGEVYKGVELWHV